METKLYSQQILQHLLCNNIFISAVAVCMCWGTNCMFNLSIHTIYYFIIFFATLSSYSIHWYYTELNSISIQSSKYQFRNSFNNKRILFMQFALSALIVLILLFLKQKFIVYLLPAIIATIIYSAPKLPIKFLKILEGKALAKTFYLAAVWIYTTNIIPILISKQKINWPIFIYLVANFIFIYLICLLFDYRDKHNDQVQYILIDTNKHFDTIIQLLSLVFVFLIIMLFILQLSIEIIIGLIISYGIVFLTIDKSKKTISDYWFYLILDGLMALPSLFVIIVQVLFNK